MWHDLAPESSTSSGLKPRYSPCMLGTPPCMLFGAYTPDVASFGARIMHIVRPAASVRGHIIFTSRSSDRQLWSSLGVDAPMTLGMLSTDDAAIFMYRAAKVLGVGLMLTIPKHFKNYRLSTTPHVQRELFYLRPPPSPPQKKRGNTCGPMLMRY